MLVSLLRTRLRPYRTPIAVLLVLQLLATLASLYLPSLNADIIDQGVTQGDTAYIMRTGGLMLLVSLGQVVCAVAAVYFGARVAMSFGRDVRAGLFTNVQRFSAQEMGQFGAPSLITRTTNDVQQVQMLVLLSLTIMVMAPIMLVGGVVMALQENVELSGLLLVIVPVLGVSVGLIIWRMVPYFRQMQKKIDGINAVLREQITGIRVIRAFVRERREAERFDVANDALFDVSLKAGKLMALMFPTVMLVMNASSIAVLWFGGRQIDAGDMEVGALTAFLSYLMYILMAVMMSTMMFMMVPRAAVSAERITDVMQTRATVVEPERPVALTTRTGRVELDGVEFRYPGAEARAPRRLVRRRARADDGDHRLDRLRQDHAAQPRAAAVRRDGRRRADRRTDVRDLTGADLGSLLGLVPQKAYLFSGTVADNLRYGRPDATEEQMWTPSRSRRRATSSRRSTAASTHRSRRAARTSRAGSASGSRSPGRSCATRRSTCSTTRSPRSTTRRTPACVRRSRPRTRRSTVIVVAQRVATIRGADQILVLDHGRIVGRGTHTELLESNETYQEIVYSQLSIEEAA